MTRSTSEIIKWLYLHDKAYHSALEWHQEFIEFLEEDGEVEAQEEMKKTLGPIESAYSVNYNHVTGTETVPVDEDLIQCGNPSLERIHRVSPFDYQRIKKHPENLWTI